MADLTVTAAQVALVRPDEARIRSYIAGATVTAGQAIYLASTGKAGLCDADLSTPAAQFRGIALNGAGAGQVVEVCEKGELYGYDLSGIAYDGLVYASGTAGALNDTANGTKTVVVGRVKCLSDSGTLTKTLYVSEASTSNW